MPGSARQDRRWDYRSRFGMKPGEASVADAVRASTAIPYYFRPARWPDEQSGREAWLVDGGMLSNFPINVFDRDDVEPRWPTFGIKLSDDPKIKDINGVVSLSRAMLSTMTGFYDRLRTIRPDVIARTIVVATDGVSATDFDLSRADAERLFENGREARQARPPHRGVWGSLPRRISWTGRGTTRTAFTLFRARS